MIVRQDYKPVHHRTWGRWRLDKKPPYPTLNFTERGIPEQIKLSRCRTPRDRELWLDNMSDKSYVTSADLGDLVRAFKDLMRQGEIPVR